MRIAHRWELDEHFVVNAQTRNERRWGPRVEVDLPVRLKLPQGRSENGRMRNLSLSGALIECVVELPMFTPLRIQIPAIEFSASEPIELTARVVRAEHPQIGIEWRDFEPQSLKDLLHPEHV